MADGSCMWCPQSKRTCVSCGVALCARHAATNGCCAVCLQEVQEAVFAGRCTTADEDAAIEAVGGPDAALYGELTPLGFRALVSHLGGLRATDSFADLGSGLGRLVVQAAKEYGVARACGVEFAASRHELAEEALAQEDESVVNRVALVEGDCSDPTLWAAGGPLADATVVYAGSLMFSEELMGKLARLIEASTSARVVASLKQWSAAPQGWCEQAPAERFETSWTAPQSLKSEGDAGTPVFVYVRA
jgi:hypothetical protein